MKAETYTRFPLSNIMIYNGVTVLHFLLGGIGIILGYGFSWIGYPLGFVYLAFSFLQMYLIMPFAVCPNCVYYGIKNSICPSGFNMISRKLAKEGNLKDFSKRGKGLFSHNKLYGCIVRSDNRDDPCADLELLLSSARHITRCDRVASVPFLSNLPQNSLRPLQSEVRMPER